MLPPSCGDDFLKALAAAVGLGHLNRRGHTSTSEQRCLTDAAKTKKDSRVRLVPGFDWALFMISQEYLDTVGHPGTLDCRLSNDKDGLRCVYRAGGVLNDPVGVSVNSADYLHLLIIRGSRSAGRNRPQTPPYEQPAIQNKRKTRFRNLEGKPR
ncbi:unnamed protein product [Pleuronectes platessa]|uniref:Uncharacterized protein n=1 Tax=Pleuronectes platessa TaxID=8262 RepID=A0A9N7UJI8_PLEPL|nr:unnamed protein product [Pleuronectes platessa]